MLDKKVCYNVLHFVGQVSTYTHQQFHKTLKKNPHSIEHQSEYEDALAPMSAILCEVL